MPRRRQVTYVVQVREEDGTWRDIHSYTKTAGYRDDYGAWVNFHMLVEQGRTARILRNGLIHWTSNVPKGIPKLRKEETT